MAIFLSTSGKSEDTSLPRVMAMIVFWIDSFLEKSEYDSVVQLQRQPLYLSYAYCDLYCPVSTENTVFL